MTLKEAVESGRPFRRAEPWNLGVYINRHDPITVNAALADYEAAIKG